MRLDECTASCSSPSSLPPDYQVTPLIATIHYPPVHCPLIFIPLHSILLTPHHPACHVTLRMGGEESKHSSSQGLDGLVNKGETADDG